MATFFSVIDAAAINVYILLKKAGKDKLSKKKTFLKNLNFKIHLSIFNQKQCKKHCYFSGVFCTNWSCTAISKFLKKVV